MVAVTCQLVSQLLDQDRLRLYLGQQKRRELSQFIRVFRKRFINVLHGLTIAKRHPGGKPCLCYRRRKSHTTEATHLIQQNIPSSDSLVHSYAVVLAGARPTCRVSPITLAFRPFRRKTPHSVNGLENSDPVLTTRVFGNNVCEVIHMRFCSFICGAVGWSSSPSDAMF